jgi:transcriptional regulator with XRE-family HTH domain
VTSKVISNVEDIRSKRGFTQQHIADVLGVSRVTYSSIKNGSRDLTVGELEKLSVFFDIPVAEFFDQPRNNEKFQQMYFYILNHFKRGVPKTKLAKLLYLADFYCFYDTLFSMSGVRYVCREYGPVADIFFETTENLHDKGKINITELNEAFMISPTTKQSSHLLSDEDKNRIDEICKYWKDKRTKEIVNFTHEQKPWKSCRDGEYIPYSLIIQEEPDHVFAPLAQG